MQWKKALDFLAELRAEGIAPNSVVYCSAIDACAKVTTVDGVVHLLKVQTHTKCVVLLSYAYCNSCRFQLRTKRRNWVGGSSVHRGVCITGVGCFGFTCMAPLVVLFFVLLYCSRARLCCCFSASCYVEGVGWSSL